VVVEVEVVVEVVVVVNSWDSLWWWFFGADSYGQTRRNLEVQTSITKIPYRGLGFNVIAVNGPRVSSFPL
jgi:hypothetical protein